MNAKTLLTIVALSGLAPQTAAAFSFSCETPAGFAGVTKRSDLPRAMLEKLKDTAMPGERWNQSDVHMGGQPYSGAYFIWHRKDLWVMEIGRGGFATIVRVEAYKVSGDGKTAREVTLPPGDPKRYDFCAEARRNAGL